MLSRIELTVAASAVLAASAILAASPRAVAQAGCQPTITQPCANAPARANNPAPGQRKPGQADDDGGPKDHSPRIRLDRDTEFKFGTGGIGLGRKF
jgi:hypothetical protein